MDYTSPTCSYNLNKGYPFSISNIVIAPSPPAEKIKFSFISDQEQSKTASICSNYLKTAILPSGSTSNIIILPFPTIPKFSLQVKATFSATNGLNFTYIPENSIFIAALN